MLKTLSFITSHPLTRDRPLAAIGRFVRWQVESRLKKEVEFDWIEGQKLIVRNGMTGATGNIYCGLHEYADMAFILHVLRPGDLFIDVGANIGSYTVLASGVCRARTIAIEPDPDTARHLAANVEVNGLSQLVSVRETAVGSECGEIRFTTGRDTTNQVAAADDPTARIVPLITLDDIVAEQDPVVIKMDVEGFETEALLGAARILANPSLLAIEIETADPKGVDILRAHGFERVSYDPVSRSIERTALSSSSNSLFIRNEPLISARVQGAPKRAYRGRTL